MARPSSNGTASAGWRWRFESLSVISSIGLLSDAFDVEISTVAFRRCWEGGLSMIHVERIRQAFALRSFIR